MSAYLINDYSHSKVKHFLGKKLEINFEGNPDLFLINEENESIKISQIREITNQIAYPPNRGQLKTFILFNFEKTTIPAQNAFLKTLEEHPSYVQIVLVCSKINKILETVISRCQTIKLKKDQFPQIENNEDENDELENNFLTITTGTHAHIIDLVENYKKREEAVEYVVKLIKHFHKKCEKNPTVSLTSAIGNLQTCLSQLEQNSNVSLTLEHHFFCIKSRF